MDWDMAYGWNGYVVRLFFWKNLNSFPEVCNFLFFFLCEFISDCYLNLNFFSKWAEAP